MTHFKGLQIFVAHFDCVCDVMMTKLLGLFSYRRAVEVISKKRKKRSSPGQVAVGIVVDLQRKIRLLRLQFMDAGPYGGS